MFAIAFIEQNDDNSYFSYCNTIYYSTHIPILTYIVVYIFSSFILNDRGTQWRVNRIVTVVFNPIFSGNFLGCQPVGLKTYGR